MTLRKSGAGRARVALRGVGAVGGGVLAERERQDRGAGEHVEDAGHRAPDT